MRTFRINRRTGFTLVEISVGLGLLSLVMVLLTGAYTSFTKYATSAIENCDAVRAVLLASEMIRHDVERMYFKTPAEDLAIGELGRSVAFRIPKTLGTTFWGTDYEPVTYGLREAAPGAEVFRLVRKDWRGEHVVGGCLLLDLLVRHVNPSAENSFDGFLEVTIVGTGSLEKRERHVGTLMLPVSRVRRPPLFYTPQAVPL